MSEAWGSLATWGGTDVGTVTHLEASRAQGSGGADVVPEPAMHGVPISKSEMESGEQRWARYDDTTADVAWS
jgi:hypothetical protein